jgi:hypothetical protein
MALATMGNTGSQVVFGADLPAKEFREASFTWSAPLLKAAG